MREEIPSRVSWELDTQPPAWVRSPDQAGFSVPPQPQSQTPAGAASLLVSAGDGGKGVVVRLASCRKGKWTSFHFCFEARHILCVPPPRSAPVLAPTTSCGQCGDEALESLGMWPSLPCGEPRPQALTSLLPGHGCPTMEATFSGLLVSMPPPLSL